jgi:hypothetical protein
MSKQELFVSVDIEADGPIPGDYSMLSFGAVAMVYPKRIIDTFYVKLNPLPDAKKDPDTMRFWKKNPEAWKEATTNQKDPGEAMQSFVTWLDLHDRYKPVFVGYPLGFDFTFISWYLMHFCGESPFKFHGIDLRTYAMAVFRKTYKDSNVSQMPKYVMPKDFANSHHALEDAKSQGELFMNLMAANFGHSFEDSLWGSA